MLHNLKNLKNKSLSQSLSIFDTHTHYICLSSLLNSVWKIDILTTFVNFVNLALKKTQTESRNVCKIHISSLTSKNILYLHISYAPTTAKALIGKFSFSIWI